MAPTVQGSRMSRSDPSSYCELERYITKHIEWNVNLDFKTNVISGQAKLQIQSRVVSDLTQVLLDIRDLDIQRVSLDETNETLQYHIDNPANVSIGSRLVIILPSTLRAKRFTINIQYATSPGSSALQWLKPEQTTGKRQPYLYSQCQAVHARSLLPCQDSPAVKFTYTAKVRAPKEITVLMSALRKEPQAVDDDQNVTSFEMQVPIPSYLIAIVAGDVESRVIGPRSKVWAAKEVLEEAAEEFSETEAMLKTAENIAGPYVWGHYDLLVLPACFPYGGMENPCLTFVTPTLLAGDKSLADVIAHEISHSWTGNLVTNINPEHFWLNEGHTMFLERKILGRLHNEAHRQIHAHEGWEALAETVKNMIEDGKECYNKLIPELVGIDPDEAFSRIPYEKGFALLAHVENVLGGPEIYEPFLRHYIQVFNGKSITSQQWKNCLFEYFSSEEDQQKLQSIDWETWFNGMGMPPVTLSYDLSSVQASLELAQRWIHQPDDDLQPFTSNDLQGFSSDDIRFFVAQLVLSPMPLSVTKVQHLETVYEFNQIRNSEIRFKWQTLCIKARWDKIIPHVLRFVNEQGRMKFVIPLNRDMYAWEEVGRPAIIVNFQKYRDEMHHTTVKKLLKILHLEE